MSSLKLENKFSYNFNYLNKIFRKSTDGIIVTNFQGKIIEWNNVMEKTLQLKKRNVLNKYIWDVEYKLLIQNGKKDINLNNIKKTTLDFINQKIKSKTLVFDKEMRINKKVYNFKINIFLLTNKNQTFLIKTIKNITKEKKLERNLNNKTIEFENINNAYKNLFVQAANPIVVIDLKGKILDVNKQMEKLSGYSKKELLSFNIYRFFLKNDLKNKSFVFDQIIQNKILKIQRKIKIKGEKEIEVEMNSALIKDKRIQIIIQDLTDKIKSENQIKAAEETYRNLFNNSQVGLFRTKIKDGHIIEANDKLAEMFGFKNRIELLSQNIKAKNIYKNKEKRNEIIKTIRSKGEIKNFEIQLFNKIDYFWVRLSAKLNKEIHCIDGVIEDITIEKIAIDALKESESKYRSIFEKANDGIVLLINNKIISFNSKTIELFNCGKDLLQNKTLNDISPKFQNNGELSSKLIQEKIKKAINGINSTTEWRFNKFNNTYFDSEISLSRIQISKKNILLAIIRDITERKEIENKIYNTIIQTEEKERKRFAEDLHDEIGPLLSSLKLYLTSFKIIKDENKQKEIITESVSITENIITNIRRISNALSPSILENMGLKAAITSLINHLDKIINISFYSNFNEIRFPINIELTYYRIIFELINNSLKHSCANKILISLDYTTNILYLTYQDNGKGFPLEKINNKNSKGTGLFNIKNRARIIKADYLFETSNGFKFTMKTDLSNL